MTPSSTSPHVVVLGDVVTDVVASLREPVAHGSDAAASIRVTGGGQAANVACWCAHAGIAATLVARAGDDSSGRERVREIADAGVAPAVATDRGAPTGTVLVLVEPGGERTMITDRGANLRLSPDDAPLELLATATHLHVSGYALLEDGPRDAALTALRRAQQAGLTTSVDPSSTQPLEAVGPARFVEWTAGVNVCLPNRDELALLAGHLGDEAAARSLASTYGEVVVTLGAEGALWTDGASTVRAPAVLADAIDSTGAGDAFTAGFLAARLRGGSPQASLAGGARLGALAVSRSGARPPAGAVSERGRGASR